MNRSRPRAFLNLLLLALMSLASIPLAAQQSLPDATGSITGTVNDVTGTPVPAAQVTLTLEPTGKQRLTATDSAGDFSFTAVPPGRFTLTIHETGLETLTLHGLLRAGETYRAPSIALKIETASTSVEVNVPTGQMAEEQIHFEERQRVIGIIPNFFVAYRSDTVPLHAKQKFKLALRDVVDPTAFAGDAIVAGIWQENNDLPGYGSGPGAYGKRYGAAFAEGTSATLLRAAVFPSLFRQDPRFYYKADGTVWARTKYALETAVICKGDNGRWQPNYSGILGNLSAGALTNLYFPEGSRNGASTTFENGLLDIAGVGVGHVLQEFVFVHLTTHRH